MTMAFSAPAGLFPGRRTAATNARLPIEYHQWQVTGTALMMVVKRQRLLPMRRVLTIYATQQQRPEIGRQTAAVKISANGMAWNGWKTELF